MVAVFRGRRNGELGDLQPGVRPVADDLADLDVEAPESTGAGLNVEIFGFVGPCQLEDGFGLWNARQVNQLSQAVLRRLDNRGHYSLPSVVGSSGTLQLGHGYKKHARGGVTPLLYS